MLLSITKLIACGVLIFIGLQTINLSAEESRGYISSPQGIYYSLEKAIQEAQEGDRIDVYGGVYKDSIIINKKLNLIGHDWPIIDGSNKGTVVRILANDVVIKGFIIKNSGTSLDEENSGLSVEAMDIIVEGNDFQNTLFGIYLKKASGTIIRDNLITSKILPLPRRGDPIRVWYSHNVVIENNIVTSGRDVVLWYSEKIRVVGNKISQGRYGLHFMYCDDATIARNTLMDNSVGTFLMYSRRLTFYENFIYSNRGPSGFGIGLKDMDDAFIHNNIFADNKIGATVDNSPRQIDSTVLYEENLFFFNDIGMRFSPSVNRNKFTRNSFKENHEQIAIAGKGSLKDNIWSINGIGNYWSDYIGFDEHQDGIGDIPYKSEKLFEDLINEYPQFRIFLFSPSSQAINFAGRVLPSIKPKPKVIDTSPLMKMIIPKKVSYPVYPSNYIFGIISAGMVFSTFLLIYVLTYLNLDLHRWLFWNGRLKNKND